MMPRTWPKALVQANNGPHIGLFVLTAQVLKDHEIGRSLRTSDTLPTWAIGQPRRKGPARREMAAMNEMAPRGDPGEHPATGAGSASTSGATS
jgi:hypothetical protein